MNKIAIAALAACLATSVSAQQQQGHQMTVTANSQFTEWAQNASRTLDSAFERVNLSRSETGITYVRFNTDANGTPQNIATVSTKERKPNLERVGRKVISNIRAMPPLFKGARPNQLIEAAIIVAKDQDQLESLTAKANQRARQQNARWAASGAPNAVVSLAVVGGF